MEATATWAEDEVYDDDQRQPPVPPLQPDQPARSAPRPVRLLAPAVRRVDLLPLPVRALPPVPGRAPGDRAQDLGARRQLARRALRQLLDPGGQQGAGRPAAPTCGASTHSSAPPTGDPGRTYEEGSALPDGRRPSGRGRFTPKRHDTRWQVAKVDHLATQTVRVKPSSGMKRWRLRVSVDLPNKQRGVAASSRRTTGRGGRRASSSRCRSAATARPASCSTPARSPRRRHALQRRHPLPQLLARSGARTASRTPAAASRGTTTGRCATALTAVR